MHTRPRQEPSPAGVVDFPVYPSQRAAGIAWMTWMVTVGSFVDA